MCAVGCEQWPVSAKRRTATSAGWQTGEGLQACGHSPRVCTASRRSVHAGSEQHAWSSLARGSMAESRMVPLSESSPFRASEDSVTAAAAWPLASPSCPTHAGQSTAALAGVNIGTLTRAHSKAKRMPCAQQAVQVAGPHLQEGCHPLQSSICDGSAQAPSLSQFAQHLGSLEPAPGVGSIPQHAGQGRQGRICDGRSQVCTVQQVEEAHRSRNLAFGVAGVLHAAGVVSAAPAPSTTGERQGQDQDSRIHAGGCSLLPAERGTAAATPHLRPTDTGQHLLSAG